VSTLRVSTFVTLDGVMQGPGDPGEFDRAGWQVQFFDEGAAAIARDGLFAADALLLGRVTYEHFAAAWPGMTDEEGFAARMNSIPKFVASRTLSDPEWNATVVRDAVSEVPKLKEEHDLLVMGSGRLVHALREHDLVDEYEIWIHPIVLGAGERLFTETTAKATTLDPSGTKTTDKGITVLSFTVAHAGMKSLQTETIGGSARREDRAGE
jgi:dihydrofolate reductase